MAAITNPQAVGFCNTKARRLADLIQSMDRTCAQFLEDVVTDFESQTGGHADGDDIADGSAEDGRRPVVKENVGQLKFVVEQLRACMGTDDRRALVNQWVTNGQPLF